MFTVCVLLYGDHTQLAKRCLNSITTASSAGYVRELRIGMNAVTDQTDAWVRSQITRIQQYYPVVTFSTDENTFKYPMMRNMFRDLPLDTDVMWFDDDSYVEAEDFWPKCAEAFAADVDMMGQLWRLPFQGKQRDWIKNQSWFNADVWNPDGTMLFCQGAWWVARAALLKEILRHKGKNIKRYDYGVRINADENGRHSKAPRRGYTEKVFAYRYDGSPLDTSHQDFFYVQGRYPCSCRS
jgi:hypothetical protein